MNAPFVHARHSDPPPTFWPDTLIEWIQAITPVLTLTAIGLTILTLHRHRKWRHEDLASERHRMASQITIKLTRDSAWRAAELYLHNGGSEVIKNIEMKLIDSRSGELIELRHRQRGVLDILASHVAAGDDKTWGNLTSDPLPTEEADDGTALAVTLRATWTDAAGWTWQMQDNRSPERTGT